MHIRRLACFLLGAWLAGSLLVHLFAVRNAGMAARTLLNLPPAASMLYKNVNRAQQTAVLGYAAAAETRVLVEWWDNTQVALALGFTFYLLFGSREGKVALVLSAAMLLITLLQRIFVTPEWIAMGRLADFAPVDAASAGRTKMELMRTAYIGLDVMKWCAGLFMTAAFIFNSGPGSALVRQDLNVVDKADHRRINR